MISLPKKMSDEEDLKRHSVSPFKKKRGKSVEKEGKKRKILPHRQKSHKDLFLLFFCSSPFYSVHPLLTEWICPQAREKKYFPDFALFFCPLFLQAVAISDESSKASPYHNFLKKGFSFAFWHASREDEKREAYSAEFAKKAKNI